MKLEDLLKARRREILRLTAKHGAYNVCVFGSAARGEAGPESDVDFLVELEPGRNMKDDKLYLIHICECMVRVEEYIGDGGRDAFMASTLVQDAVLRNLQTLAESTQRLSDELKAAHPEVEWYKIAGFRNVLVHDYLGVDLERVWLIIERELPALMSAISAMLQQ